MCQASQPINENFEVPPLGRPNKYATEPIDSKPVSKAGGADMDDAKFLFLLVMKLPCSGAAEAKSKLQLTIIHKNMECHRKV